MAVYTIRSGFTINLNGSIYQGGEEVELTDNQFKLHKHKLEGVTDDFEAPQQSAPPAPSFKPDCTCFPAPFVSSLERNKILVDVFASTRIFGSFFSPDTTVSLSQGEILKTDFISSNELRIDIKAPSTPTKVDLVLNNGAETVRAEAIEFFEINFVLADLRLGGTDFSSLAIEMRDGMSFTRTQEGLFFQGSAPWSSWARFVGDNDDWVWNRRLKKTLNWIVLIKVDSMVGIGSRASNPASRAQYYQGETLVYLNNAQVIGIYGNSGEVGSGNPDTGSRIDKNPDIPLKIKMIGNAEQGATIFFYELKTINIEDWFDDTNLIGSISINNIAPDEPDIMPFVIPRDGEDSKFVGFFFEDESEI